MTALCDNPAAPPRGDVNTMPALTPYLACSNEYCAMEQTWPVEQLRMAQDRLLCEDCFDGEELDGALGDWNDLPPVNLDDIPDRDIYLSCYNTDDLNVWGIGDVAVYEGKLICYICFDEVAYKLNEKKGSCPEFGDLPKFTVQQVRDTWKQAD